jgi:thioredoxin reductase (NADPH)
MEQDVLSKKEIHDVIIIGGGPAGLTAGIYTSRARISTLLIEKLGIGGQASITDRIENYPGFIEGISGPELIRNMEEQAKSFGVRTVFGEVTRVEVRDGDTIKRVFVHDDSEPYQCLSIIVAAGHEQRKLGVPGEMEFTGRGVFFRDRAVAVVGGGDVAVEEALFLTRFVSKVYIVHRRDRLRATKILQERAAGNDKIAFVFDSVLDEVSGQTTVNGVKVRNVKTGQTEVLAVDGVFVFIGWNPNLSFLGTVVDRSEDGYIIVDKEMTTTREGIFACGDCCKKKLRQIVAACGDGATAAFSAQHYVEMIKGEAYV